MDQRLLYHGDEVQRFDWRGRSHGEFGSRRDFDKHSVQSKIQRRGKRVTMNVERQQERQSKEADAAW